MAITRDNVLHVAKLARLELTEAEIDRMQSDLSGILDYVNQLSELDTNEYLAFRAMETGVCMEQRVVEQDRTWIKKAIPLVAGDSPGWISKLPGTLGRHPVGAIIVIQDVTLDVRKEQEIKVKSAMIQEIHHRVKNNLQTITALLRLQARRAKSEDAALALKEAVGRIMSVAVVHEFLSRLTGGVARGVSRFLDRQAPPYLRGRLLGQCRAYRFCRRASAVVLVSARRDEYDGEDEYQNRDVPGKV